jgi:hypothetical protein
MLVNNNSIPLKTNNLTYKLKTSIPTRLTVFHLNTKNNNFPYNTKNRFFMLCHKHDLSLNCIPSIQFGDILHLAHYLASNTVPLDTIITPLDAVTTFPVSVVTSITTSATLDVSL